MKLSARQTLQKGFTLIELLVVIGILGILAAALVATIDPFEQLNKGTDARTENTLVELQNGLLRYYTIKGNLPWTNALDECMGPGGAPDGSQVSSEMEDCVEALIDQGELKESFINSPDLENIYVTEESTNNVVLCYEPVSKAKQRDPNTEFDASGEPGVDCQSQDGDQACYWCSR